MSSNSSACLPSLPGEVRQKIWNVVFSDAILRPKISQPASVNGAALFDSHLELHNGHRSLLLTSKRIRAEAAHLLDESMTLYISADHLLSQVNQPLSPVALSKIKRVFVTQEVEQMDFLGNLFNAMLERFPRLQYVEMYWRLTEPDELTALNRDTGTFRQFIEAENKSDFGDCFRACAKLVDVVPGLRAAFVVSSSR